MGKGFVEQVLYLTSWLSDELGSLPIRRKVKFRWCLKFDPFSSRFPMSKFPKRIINPSWHYNYSSPPKPVTWVSCLATFEPLVNQTKSPGIANMSTICNQKHRISTNLHNTNDNSNYWKKWVSLLLTAQIWAKTRSIEIRRHQTSTRSPFRQDAD